MNGEDSNKKFVILNGTILPGHRIASGQAKDPRFPQGTIALQKPLFAKLGLDLSKCFMGTLNISISPKQFKIINPSYNFPNVKWTNDFPEETFSFSPCRIMFAGGEFDCFVYYPHPETKPGYFQPPNVLEVLGPKIEGLSYGTEIKLAIDTNQIQISD